MSASTAIGMVSASLRNLLVGRMQLTPAVDVTVLAPDETAVARRVNLFLYKVTQNPFLRNEGWTVRRDDPATLADTALSLNLFYLLTAYAPNDAVTGNVNAHQLLGDAMRVLHETPVVPHEFLEPGLRSAREQLQVALYAVDPEELSRIWTTFSQPFRLSVLYEVSTVQLDRVTGDRPLPERVRRVGVPAVRTSYRPPVVTGMAPTAGTAGTTLTFTGEHLDGWRCEVTLGDEQVTATDTRDDGFSVTAPAGLAPGLHELRVEVSSLFRRTFLFEVTP
jgi:hypothetical protein